MASDVGLLHDDREGRALVMQQIATVIVATVGLAVIATPIVISSLKGRWWIGVTGATLFATAFVVLFSVVGGEPDAALQETTTFKAVEATINLALCGGALLLILGAAMRPRAGSWWDLSRGTHPTHGKATRRMHMCRYVRTAHRVTG